MGREMAGEMGAAIREEENGERRLGIEKMKVTGEVRLPFGRDGF